LLFLRLLIIVYIIVGGFSLNFSHSPYKILYKAFPPCWLCRQKRRLLTWWGPSVRFCS
jgi:hypothetical protein